MANITEEMVEYGAKALYILYSGDDSGEGWPECSYCGFEANEFRAQSRACLWAALDKVMPYDE